MHKRLLNSLQINILYNLHKPSGANIEEGDLWYNTLTDNLYVYRETSANNFEWVAIASATGDMDTLDGDIFV